MFCIYLLFLSLFSLPPGTAFTLLHNACQPPPFSLPSSGQAVDLPLLPPSSLPSSRPVILSPLSVPSADAAFPLSVLLSAPPLHCPLARLRVPQGRRSRNWAWRFPRGTRRPEGRQQPEGCSYPSALLPRLSSTSPHQSQVDQLTQHCCHPGGQL